MIKQTTFFRDWMQKYRPCLSAVKLVHCSHLCSWQTDDKKTTSLWKHFLHRTRSLQRSDHTLTRVVVSVDGRCLSWVFVGLWWWWSWMYCSSACRMSSYIRRFTRLSTVSAVSLTPPRICDSGHSASHTPVSYIHTYITVTLYQLYSRHAGPYAQHSRLATDWLSIGLSVCLYLLW